jgi:hypothetical protein
MMNTPNWMQNVWYWKIAIFECLTEALTAAAMVLISALANQDWKQINGTARFIIYLTASVAFMKSIKNFLSQTMSILQGWTPPDPGKTAATTVAVINSGPAPATAPKGTTIGGPGTA